MRNGKNQSPSANGDNGRGDDGKFLPGNSHGKGNPHARQTAQLRAALLEFMTPDALKSVIGNIAQIARDPKNPAAVRLAALVELLDRTLGKPGSSELVDRVELIEERIERIISKLDGGQWNSIGN